MATPMPREQAPLNSEREEREIGKMEIGEEPQTTEEQSLKEMGEKLKKPTIGVSLIVFLILNIVMFVVGIVTINDCPVKEIIPIYLIVAGAIGVVTKVTPILNRNKRFAVVDIILSILFLIEFIWMILGSVWVYGIYAPNYNPDYPPYCNKTAYLLAFWLLTIHYIFMLLSLLIPCCIMCCCCCITGIAVAKLQTCLGEP